MPQHTAGNIDLYAQPVVKNADGTSSTVDSRSFNFDGKEVLLPSVTPDGRHLKTDDEIVAEYKKTGRHLGMFSDVASANAYATQLHNDYAVGKYDKKQNMADQKHEYTVTIDGHDYDIESPTELTDEQAYLAAKQEADKPDTSNTSMVGGVARGLLKSPISLMKGAIDTVKAGYNSTVNPSTPLEKTIRTTMPILSPVVPMVEGAINTVKNLPATAKEAIRLYQENPGELGEHIGDIGGQAALGMAVGKFGPTSLPAISRGAGTVIKNTGKGAGWPIRMAGAHQMTMGNIPVGAAMMALPDAIEAVGTKLIRAGTPAGEALTTPIGRIARIENDLELAARGNAEALTKSQSELVKLNSEISDKLTEAKLPEDVKELRKLQKDISKLSRRAETLAGAESVGTSAADELVKSGFARDKAQAEQILKGRSGAVSSHTPSTSLVQEPGAMRSEISRILQGTIDRSAPIHPPISTRPVAADFEQEMTRQGMATHTTSRPVQAPVSSVRPTATSREMSATPGLSRNDVMSIGMNPDNPIKKLTLDMANKIMQDRSMRATGYQEIAALKKRLEELMSSHNQ